MESIRDRFNKTRNGIYLDSEDNFRVRGIVTQLVDLIDDHIAGAKNHARTIVNYFNQGSHGFSGGVSYNCVNELIGTTNSLALRIERCPSLVDNQLENVKVESFEAAKHNALSMIADRFHAVAMQLRQCYSSRKTLDVNDEYDVQDLFHVLLKLYFDDVRPEEWNPLYAGGASRSDFLLPEIDTVVEVKKTRPSMSTKELGEQLLVDIQKYKKHPQCRRLVCFVYDPDGRVSNPRGMEADLNGSDSEIDVVTMIVPKHI